MTILTWTVWKYKIPMKDSFSIEMPDNHSTLTVQLQNNEPYIWVLVETSDTLIKAEFRLAGTGHAIEYPENDGLNYIGSFQMENGRFIFHLFEVY